MGKVFIITDGRSLNSSLPKCLPVKRILRSRRIICSANWAAKDATGIISRQHLHSNFFVTVRKHFYSGILMDCFTKRTHCSYALHKLKGCSIMVAYYTDSRECKSATQSAYSVCKPELQSNITDKVCWERVTL